jgi:cytochrome P450 family 4
MFLFLLLVLVIFVIFWYQVNYGHRNDLMAKIPSPRSYPLIRNTLEFYGKSPKDMFNMTRMLHLSLGKIYQITLHPFDNALVFVSDPKMAEAILSSQKILDKSEDYDLMKGWLGSGLLTSTGANYHQRRKILTPSFHFQILEKFVEIMDEQGKVLVDKLKKMNDVFPLVNLYALDVICGP